MKKNIAILHYTFLPVIAGVEIQMKGQAEILTANKHKVKIVVGQGKSQSKDYKVKVIEKMSPRDKEVRKLQKELEKGRVSSSFSHLKEELIFALKKEIRTADVCILHNCQTMSFNFALTAALKEIIEEPKPKTKFFIWCHDLAPTRKNYPFPKKGYPFNLLTKPLKGAEYIAISEFRKRQLAKIFPSQQIQIKMIPDGIDLKTLLNIEESIWQFQQKINLLDSNLIMFYPSRILKRKNFELSFKITKNLKKNFKNVKLLISGPSDIADPTDTYYNSLSKLTKKLNLTKNVYFLRDFKKYFKNKKLDFSQLRDLYKLSDLLLFSSREEGCGLPLLEAGAFGIPIAASDMPPFREIGEKEIFYFDLNQAPEKIAQKISKYLFSSPNFLMKRKIRKDYTWEAIYKKYLKPILKI